MNKLIYILIITLFTSSFSFAQNINNEEENIDINDKYIFGMNSGKYVTRKSLENLSDNIYYEFLNNGSTKEQAKIITAYALKEMQSQFKENAEEIYDIFKLGYFYDESKDTQLACSDKFIQGSIAYEISPDEYNMISDTRNFAWRNRALTKARDILKEESSMEDKFYSVLTMYIEDGLGSITSQRNELMMMKDEGFETGQMVEFLSANNVCENSAYCDGLVKLYTFIMDSEDNLDKNKAAEYILNNNLFKYAFFQNGYFNIYNDGFYEMVQVSKVKEFSILSILENSPLNNKYDFLYARYFKLFDKSNKEYDSSKYNPLHCTNNVYNGHLYIFPFDNQVYLINTTETENKLLKIEVRAPEYFNTNYGKNYSTLTAFQDIETSKRNKSMALHKVSNMGTFSYNNNILTSVVYDREPQSPMGDVDKVKERRGQKIMPAQLENKLNNTKFSKKTEKAVSDYVEYLQEFTSKKLIEDELYFYVINTGKDKVVLAASSYYNDFNEKEEILFMVNNKNLKIINKDIAAQIDNVLSSGKYYKTLVSNNDDTVFIGFIQTDNNIFIVNVIDNKAGSNMFPVYYYKKTDITAADNDNNKLTDPALSYPLLQEAAGIDCTNTDSESEVFVCSYRQLLTVKAYVEKLYNLKMEKAEQNYYPENIKEYYRQIHDDMQFMYQNNCSNDIDCIMDIFLSYADIFSR